MVGGDVLVAFMGIKVAVIVEFCRRIQDIDSAVIGGRTHLQVRGVVIGGGIKLVIPLQDQHHQRRGARRDKGWCGIKVTLFIGL